MRESGICKETQSCDQFPSSSFANSTGHSEIRSVQRSIFTKINILAFKHRRNACILQAFCVPLVIIIQTPCLRALTPLFNLKSYVATNETRGYKDFERSWGGFFQETSKGVKISGWSVNRLARPECKCSVRGCCNCILCQNQRSGVTLSNCQCPVFAATLPAWAVLMQKGAKRGYVLITMSAGAFAPRGVHF